MRGRPPTIKEEDILDAARDVFRELGHAATTAKIAERAAVSEGILFYRYKSKEALLAEVIHRETQPPSLLRNMARAAGERSVRENLVAVVGTLLDGVFRAHPFLELAESSPTSSEIRRVLFMKTRKPPPQVTVECIAAYFEAEMRLGRVRTMAAMPAARAIFGGCIDYVRAQRMAGVEGDRPAFVRGLVDVILHGTLKTGTSRQSR
jgi:AcrR family transcriptional regulator